MFEPMKNIKISEIRLVEKEDVAETSSSIDFDERPIDNEDPTDETKQSCPVCSQQLIDTDTFTTPCQHSFCKECISLLQAHALLSLYPVYSCPQCSEKFNIVADLPAFHLKK